MAVKLEIACGNFFSALAAQQGGADRIELCDNLLEGGTTPSAGMIRTVRKHLTIPIHVIIRPRGGDFLYSSEEFEAMKEDILFCKKNGVDGVVIGCLQKDGHVDTKRTKELADLASPMSVTFHRAFDVSRDPRRALEEIIECGCDRLLSSGMAATAVKGVGLLRELIELSNGRLVIMPGGGVREENVRDLLHLSGATEVHSSCRTIVNSHMEFQTKALTLGTEPGDDYRLAVTDPEMVKRLKRIIEAL